MCHEIFFSFQAIWMLPRDWHYGGWPRSGEIDIMESRGKFIFYAGICYTCVFMNKITRSSNVFYLLSIHQFREKLMKHCHLLCLYKNIKGQSTKCTFIYFF